MATEAKRVLIVDDEPDVREFVKAALADEGYEFVEAGDGEEALIKAMANVPDLAILDVQMPKKDGFQLFADLRRGDTTKSMPVIMLTAVTQRTGIGFNAQDVGNYLGSEPEAYIDKPIDPATLSQTVRKLLGAGG